MVQFFKEILMFGVEAFVVVASREVARRFWQRLASRGAAALLEAGPEGPIGTEQKEKVVSASSGQARLPFLDEYRD
jgi:hypothetical protein